MTARLSRDKGGSIVLDVTIAPGGELCVAAFKAEINESEACQLAIDAIEFLSEDGFRRLMQEIKTIAGKYDGYG